MLIGLPEGIERTLVGVVPANFRDAAVLRSHELAARDIQVPPLVHGGRTLHGDYVFLPNCDVEKFSTECVA